MSVWLHGPARMRLIRVCGRSGAVIAASLFACVRSAGAQSARQTTPSVRPLKVVDEVSAQHIQEQSRPAISPDGQWVAYTACDPSRVMADSAALVGRDVAQINAYDAAGCEVRVASLSTAGGQPRAAIASSAIAVPAMHGNSWGGSWSPNGRELAFLSDRGGGARVWILDVASGETRMAADLTTKSQLGWMPPMWARNGREIVVTLYPDTSVPGSKAPVFDLHAAGGTQDHAVSGATVTVYHAGPGTGAGATADTVIGAGVLEYLRADLGVIDVATGRVRRLVRGEAIGGYWVSPDGQAAVYARNTGMLSATSQQSRFDLVVVDLRTGRSRSLVTGVEQYYGTAVSWSPDGSKIAYISGPGDSSGTCFIVDLSGSPPHMLQGSGARFYTTLFGPLWDESGEYVYVANDSTLWRGATSTWQMTRVTTIPGHAIRAIVPAQGDRRLFAVSPMPSPARSVDHLLLVAHDLENQDDSVYHVVADRVDRRVVTTRIAGGAIAIGNLYAPPMGDAHGQVVVFQREDASHPADLWAADGAFEQQRQITTLNPALADYEFGTSRLISYSSSDGQRLHAAVLLPSGYKPGRRYPTVVDVYPGAMLSTGVNAFGLAGIGAFNLQLLATRGYVVIKPDAPVRYPGKLVRGLLADVLPAVDASVALGLTDADRVAVMGQSGGGYAVMALITHTNRFRAAIAMAGYGDLAAAYGMFFAGGAPAQTSWLEGDGPASMHAAPWDAPFQYVENSPVYYLQDVDTPLLIEAGGTDFLAPYSDEMFSDLKRLGKDVTYLRYAGEGHVLSSGPNITDFWLRAATFLESQLRVRTGGDHVTAVGSVSQH